MRTNLFKTVILAVFAGACLARGADQPATRIGRGKPNILFILTDDQGWRDAGCYGSTFYQTRYIDQLAREGMRFTHAYAAPVCSPTRASIMTGRSPARLHMTHITQFVNPIDKPLQGPTIRKELPLDELTIAQVLRNAGYVTAAIGKWHLGGPGFEPQDHGFDINIAGGELGQPPDYFFPWQRRVDNALFQIPHLAGGREGEYLTDRLTDEAIRFIEGNRDKPFFLYLAHYAPHTSMGARLQGIDQTIAKYISRVNPADPQTNPIYAAMLENLDDNIGRLLQRLDQLKLADNTLVVFMSDNGGYSPSTSNAPLRDGKGSLYEGGIRVPMIIRWPAVVHPGSVSDTPVTASDFFPTFREIVLPGEKLDRAIDGVSLLPVLTGAGPLSRDALYWHFPHYTAHTKPCSAIHAGDYKLIAFYEDARMELYNLKNDPGESEDIAAKLPDRAAELHEKLAAWLKSVNADMPTRKPKAK